MTLTTLIEVPREQTDAAELQVTLRITNRAAHSIALLNPDMGNPTPKMDWSWSNEAYQTSLLLSFGYLSMSVRDKAGQELPRQDIETWATPALLPEINLASGDSIEIIIPIGTFYPLTSGETYQVRLEYGDKKVKVLAQSCIPVP